MAFNRRTTSRRPRGRTRTFIRRGSPLRTRATKETRWNTSRYVTIRDFNFVLGESQQNVDMVILNPRLMFELTLQPDTPIGGPVRNIAPIVNTLQALRGVKVGGFVWDSGFHCQVPVLSQDDEFVNAFSRVTETLWTREIEQEDGIPDNPPDMQSTWRPIRVDDSVFDPTENSGDLVRIHHTRSSLIAAGTNAFGAVISPETDQGIAPHASTWTMPGWGGTRSIRLRKFIADNQQLSFNLVATNPNSTALEQAELRWVVYGTLYWAMQGQR